MRAGTPELGTSTLAFGGATDVRFRRFCVAQDAEWKSDFLKAGWTGRQVDFLIWPRASWPALRPDRYWNWFWTRDTLPAAERDLPQEKWRRSILSGSGEWSHATAWIGTPPGS